MTPLSELHGFPPDLIAAIEADAERDADEVGAALNAMGFGGTGASVPNRDLPVSFLLGLGIVFRLRRWQKIGVPSHLLAGLPDPEFLRATLTDICATANGLIQIMHIGGRLLQIVAENFAWAGSTELSADILLGDADEDVLLNALAEFAWNNRKNNGGLRREKSNSN